MSATIAAFPDADAFKHKLAADGREALAYMLLMPEHGIAGSIYPSFRATGPGKVRVGMFGPGLESAVEEEVEADYPASMDFDDCRIGPLHMAIRNPHKIIDLSWNSEQVSFEGQYQALHPPYAFSSHPDGIPPYYGDDRTEQHGTMTARVRIAGRSFEHRGFAIQDHSWGPRVWGLNQHYKWVHFVTAQTSVHFFEMLSFGRRHMCGYLWKDGVMRHLAQVDYRIVYDAEMWQQEFFVTATDTDGRRVTISSQTFARWLVDWTPGVYLNETAMTLEMDGQTGAGWLEFCWNKDYFDFAKDHVVRFGGGCVAG